MLNPGEVAVIRKGLDQLTAEGLWRIVDCRGGMLLNGVINNKLTGES